MARLGLPEEQIPTLEELMAPDENRLDLIDFGYPRRDLTETPAWDAASPATGGAFHIGHDIWRTRCRGEGCSKFVDSIGAVPRYATIGKHEYAAHGLDVAGINVGLLQTS